MKKLSKLMESVWSDMQDRGTGDVDRKEDEAWRTFELDGKKYKLSRNVELQEKEFLEENDGDQWDYFGFNIPKDSNVIDEVGFACKDYYIGGDDDYDAYCLRSYIEKPVDEVKREMYDKMIACGHINEMNIKEIKDILLKYTKQITDEFLGEYARYQVYALYSSDYGDGYAIYVNADAEYVPDDVEFPSEYIEDEHNITYPLIDGWYENLVFDITEAYKKLGWVISTQHRLDDYDSPRMTDDVVFIKLKEGYKPGMDDEDENDYTI